MRKLYLVLIFLCICFSLVSCGNNENNNNPCENGHDFGAWTVVKEATCLEEGKEERVCSRDSNHKEERTISKGSHNFVNGICTVCGQSETEYRGAYYDLDNFVSSSEEVKKTTLVTYDGPSYLVESEVYDVKVNDKDLFVYDTRVNNERQFSWTTPQTKTQFVTFDFEGSVTVTVTANNISKIESALVRPQIYGIVPKIEGNKVTFTLEYSGNYVLELNDDSNTALQIFANGLEENPITEEDAKNDPNIYYVGPGVYKADAIPVADNATIYLAGGAYVYGQIRAEGLQNLTIRGRGIISGEIYNRRSESEYTLPIEIRSSKNVKIEDLIFVDPAGWTITLFNSEDVLVNNIKIITARQNGDGISVQSCKNVTITGGYVRTWDDSLVVKNTGNLPTSNIKFEGVTVWTDLAQSMEIGYEAFGETMEDITFNNIIVIHNFHKAVISMHNADDAKISRVKYTNIIVEDCQTLGDNRTDSENDFLIDLCVLYNLDWSTSTNILGTVKDVTIDNVKVYKILDSIISRVSGFSNVANIDGVHISNIEIEGRKINSLDELKLVSNAYTSNIEYNLTSDKIMGAKVNLPYKLALESEEVSYIHHENVSQEGMIVPEFARSKGSAPYIGVPVNETYTVSATHGAGNKTSTPSDDGSGDWSKDGSAGFAADGNFETVFVSKDFKQEDDEFVSLTIDFDKVIKVGVVRIYGDLDNEFYYTYKFQIWGKKLKSDGTINDKYTRIIGVKDYALSPISNNIIDVNITTQEYAGIQIRFYRGTDPTSVANYRISEVEFYAPSLSFQAPIVSSTPHNDVYTIEKVVDGDATGTSYYESAELPAHIIIDLGDKYKLNTIVLSLPPSIKWDARTQEIAIYYSDSNVSYSETSTVFNTLVEQKAYLFDPLVGNRVIININDVEARFLKFVIISNDTKGGYNAQLSEISVYGE